MSGRTFKGRQRVRSGQNMNNPDRVTPKGVNAPRARDRATINRLQMYRGKAIRNRGAAAAHTRRGDTKARAAARCGAAGARRGGGGGAAASASRSPRSLTFRARCVLWCRG